MPNLSLYYNVPGSVVPVSVVFLSSTGVAADPDTVTLMLTDPNGNTTNVAPASLTHSGTGKYSYNFTAGSATLSGLWNYTWVGAGENIANGCQVTPGSFRLFDANTASGTDRTYISVDELKSSLNDSSGQSKDDYELQRACITATTLIHDLCGQHFYQVNEARTFSYESIYEMFIDPVVPGSITEFAIDYNGTGVYDTIWTEGVDFQTLRYNEKYNARWIGEARPHDFVRILMSSGGSAHRTMLPFVWAYTPNNRVKITATWGWPQVPNNIEHAALLLAVDLFKMKDAPWGVAGMGELGMVKTQANPEVMELLTKYREPRNLVGV